MSEKELYSLLCSYKTVSHHGKLNKLMKSGKLSGATAQSIHQIFKLVTQLCKSEDGVGVSQLIALLSKLLPKNNYNLVDEAVLNLLKDLHDHLKKLRKTHYIHKIYLAYVNMISELLREKIKCKVPLTFLFAPILFHVALEDAQYFPYDLRMEAAKSLNILMENEDGADVHNYLVSLPEVKAQWLDIGEAVAASGDFELQVTLMELMFRLLSPKERRKFAPKLFPDDVKLQNLLLDIKDAQFERDCRTFLNALNGSLQQRMVYSFKCTRVSVPGIDELNIPPHQNWVDVNFGSKAMTMFLLSLSEDGGSEYDTLIINPKSVTKHTHSVEGNHFHLILTLNVTVSSLLQDRKGGDSHTIHFVIDKTPDPKGPILGLLGQNLPESPKLSKMARVDVSEETIQICGNVTRIVSTPHSEREDRLSQTRKMLAAKIPGPLPQFEIGSSQPQQHKLRSFIASEPILANPLAPRSSPVEDSVLPSTDTAIPDSLPINIIPDTQKNIDNNDYWQLQSSFDYNARMDDSEISDIGEDTIKAFAKTNVLEENTESEDVVHGDKLSPEKSNIQSSLSHRGKRLDGSSNLASAVTNSVVCDDSVVSPQNPDQKPSDISKKRSTRSSSKGKSVTYKSSTDCVKEEKGSISKQGTTINCATLVSAISINNESKSAIAKIQPSNLASADSQELPPDQSTETICEILTVQSAPTTTDKGIKNSKRPLKKPLKFEKSIPPSTIIKVGANTQKEDSTDCDAGPIVIKNNFAKKNKDDSDIQITNVVQQDVIKVDGDSPNTVGEKDSPKLEIDTQTSPKADKSTTRSFPENSPELSQKLEQINFDISNEIPSSPGDLYKEILDCAIEGSPAKILNAKNSPIIKKIESLYKRKLMDTEGDFLCSQESQSQDTLSSQVKKVPAFARKRETSANTSASFVVSKNKSLQNLGVRPRKNSNEALPDDTIPIPPVRRSILKKKFLDKSVPAAIKTPEMGTFNFDLKSPSKESENSWGKTVNKKKRVAGFKTKKEKLIEQKAIKRQLKAEHDKDKPVKKLKKRRTKEDTNEDENESEADLSFEDKPKLEPKKQSPSPPPLTRSSRYSMRRQGKKVNYRDPKSDDDGASATASEFSTTTNSTVARYLSRNRQNSPPSTATNPKIEAPIPEPEPEAILADLERSLDEDNCMIQHDPSELLQSVVGEFDRVFSQSLGSQKPKTSTKSKAGEITQFSESKTTIDDIAMISALYDNDTEFQLTDAGSEEAENSSESPPPTEGDDEVTCIPSTDIPGIPLTFKTDSSSIPSMVSKDPSPIIKTNFFKLPNSQIKSITLNLSPQIKQISPAVSIQEDEAVHFEDADVIAKVFGEKILQEEAKRFDPTSKKYNRTFKKQSKNKKVKDGLGLKDQSSVDFDSHLDTIQDSLNHIKESTVLQVSVSNLSEVQRTFINENKPSEKEGKVWLDGSQSESSFCSKEEKKSSVLSNDTLSENLGYMITDQSNHITSVAPVLVKDDAISEQFREVSNCMVTEADSSGMLMDIEECNTPYFSEEEHQNNIFSNILEESRLAGKERSKAPSKLVSTPTKLSHIKEAEIANISPFQQFLERIGGVKSPIKENKKVRSFGLATNNETCDDRFHKTLEAGNSKASDSGLGRSGDSELGILHSFGVNFSLPIPPANSKQSKRKKIASPTVKRSCLEVTPTKEKCALSAQSPGRQELDDYYNMLCKTPGKSSQTSSLPSSQPAGESISQRSSQILSQGGLLPDVKYGIKLSPVCASPVNHHSTGQRSTEDLDERSACSSEKSSFIIPQFMIDTDSGIALQMLQKQSQKMKQIQLEKTKDNIDLISKDLNSATKRFFNTAESKRKSKLDKYTEGVNENISNMQCEIVNIKRKEEAALRGIAHAHKVQKESRIAIETKMSFLKESSQLPSMTTDEIESGLRELRESLRQQLDKRQKELDKNHIQQHRKQVMKQMALIMMSEFE